jgi:hypothetical protein
MISIGADGPVVELIHNKVRLSSAPAPGRLVVVVPRGPASIAATADLIGISAVVPDAGIPFDALPLHVSAQVLDVDATEPSDLDVGKPQSHQPVEGAARHAQPPGGILNRQQGFVVVWGRSLTHRISCGACEGQPPMRRA